MRLMMAALVLVLASSVAWADDSCRGCGWQKRESWIIGEQDEESALISELAFELDLSAGLVLVLPAAELGWWANCAAAAHDAAGTVTIQGKINRLEFLKGDLPYQNNILMQQLRNNPSEWHRFMQTQQPFLEKQEQLRRQGSHMKHPAACKKKRNPQSNRSAQVPANCSALFAQEKQLSQAMIFTPSPEAKAPVKRQLDMVEQELIPCRQAILGPNAAPQNLYSQFPLSRPPPSSSGRTCGQGVRC
jgi:hypothetical protein